MQAEFNASNSYRCAQAEMPFCACDNPASPPPAGHAPPPPFVYTEEWHAQPSYVDGERPVRGGGVTDVATPWTADEGQVSALTKRLVNGRTISLSASCTPIEPHSYTSHTHARRATVACAWQIRSSHRVVDCPGDDDAEPTCARVCAQEHLGFLRAFAVPGARHTPPPPSLPPPRPAPPAAPLPPHAPFSECLNTCDDKLAVGDAKCREGAKGAYLPTLCEYSTNCRNCGFRENTDAIESDDSCAHANDGVCQDGGTGSSFQAETTFGYGGLTHLCGLGTDRTDCAIYGARTTQQIGLDSFQGLTNASRPTPPPPQPLPPPPPSPAPPRVAECAGCRAWFVPKANDVDGTGGGFAHVSTCHGTVAQCQPPQTDAIDLCSDGGAGAHAALTGDDLDLLAAGIDGLGVIVPKFACNYGTQCALANDPNANEYRPPCGTDQRPRDAVADPACSDDRIVDRETGECRDACFVDEDGEVHLEEERFSAIASDNRCHDGGPRAVSNKCPYGTQVFA